MQTKDHVPEEVFEIVKQVRLFMHYMSQQELQTLVIKYIKAQPGTEAYKKRYVHSQGQQYKVK